MLEEERARERFEKQVAVMERVRSKAHPNIIGYEGYYVIKNEGEDMVGNMVSELGICSLEEVIEKQAEKNEFMTAMQVMSFMQSTLDAVVHLQGVGVAHYNLKPENLILTDAEELRFKVTDMQPEKVVEERQSRTLNIAGTVSFMAPEVFESYRKFNYKVRCNPYKSDVYSLGLLWLYFATHFKFTLELRSEINKQRYEKNIGNLIFSAVCNYPNISGLREVLELCLNQNPAERDYADDLQRKIRQNGWLDFKDPSPPALSKTDSSYVPQTAEVDEDGVINFKLPRQMDKVEFYNKNAHLCSKANFDLNL